MVKRQEYAAPVDQVETPRTPIPDEPEVEPNYPWEDDDIPWQEGGEEEEFTADEEEWQGAEIPTLPF